VRCCAVRRPHPARSRRGSTCRVGSTWTSPSSARTA
jgi:hypothetical protein